MRTEKTYISLLVEKSKLFTIYFIDFLDSMRRLRHFTLALHCNSTCLVYIFAKLFIITARI